MTNKFKEFLWFLIPFLCLSFISVIYFVLNTSNGAMYFRLMISDPFFIIALVNTFVPSLILSFVVVFIYKIILRFFSKKTVTGRKKHIIVFLVSLIAPVCYIIIMTRTFDFVNNTIFTLQTGIIVTFVFWVIDIIKENLKKKKARQE
ncbi:MAG: hypothetical protein IKD04_08390 [Clostridia bacterium]|nr:hypothetical protein [Clostridia bacterium]